jgi:hypothetical protein
MPVAARGNAQIMFVGEADDSSDVLYRTRLEHRDRLTMHEAAVVFGRRRQRGRVRAQHPVQMRQVVELRGAGRLGAGHPAAIERIESDDERAGNQALEQISACSGFHAHSMPPTGRLRVRESGDVA